MCLTSFVSVITCKFYSCAVLLSLDKGLKKIIASKQRSYGRCHAKQRHPIFQWKVSKYGFKEIFDVQLYHF